MSKRLYYDNAYATAFTSQIVEQTETNDQHAVVLAETYFYPEGGGQPADKGTLNEVAVIDVQSRRADNAVLHILDQPLQAGEVTASVDWKRRFDHMQQHTGQHILTQAFVQLHRANTVGFHLSERTLTIDLDMGDLSLKKLEQAEHLANDVLFENRPVTARLYPADELPDGVRVRKIPEAMSTDGVRVIEVQDFDYTACGGTHVAATGEIGVLKIVNVQPYKGGSRIDFACGWRALDDYSSKNRLMQQAGALLSAKYTEVPALIESLQTQLKEQHGQLQAALEELASFIAADLVAQTPIEDGIRVVPVIDPQVSSQMLASMLVAHPETISLIGQSGEKVHIIAACSIGLEHNMNTALQAVFAELGGGRGGGRPTMAQGGGVSATAEQIRAAFAAVEATLRDG